MGPNLRPALLADIIAAQQSHMAGGQWPHGNPSCQPAGRFGWMGSSQL